MLDTTGCLRTHLLSPYFSRELLPTFDPITPFFTVSRINDNKKKEGDFTDSEPIVFCIVNLLFHLFFQLSIYQKVKSCRLANRLFV